MLNTAKSISKGLAKISESVVSSMVKNKPSSSSNQLPTAHSPRMTSAKKRHDSKEELRAGICTIIDTKKLSHSYQQGFHLHHEKQNWIVAHFLAHQEPIYALEFNPNGRLLVTADCLGQYFNVFQINPSPFKCTRSNIKHLYSLYRGDTGAKVRDISFSIDSRWLAVSTKRGTTHIFAINIDGGTINARTHSKPFVANKTSKHQRTSGFLENEIFKTDDSESSPTHLVNNPKLRHFLEPFIIPAYGQLKQPNTNSSFHSSVISSNSSNSLLDYVPVNTNLPTQTSANIAMSALHSAAMVTENVSHLASNTSNMIQYDNVHSVSLFAESRGFLKSTYHDPMKLKPVNSLFVISDINGNLVEYALDVVVDSGKTSKPSNDSPVVLRISPKAQWPLNRFISNDEVPCPIQSDNPLMKNLPTRSALSKQASYEIPTSTFVTATSLCAQNTVNCEWIKMIEVNTHLGPHRRLFMGPQFIFKTFNSSLSTCTINAGSSSVLDNESGSIDLSGDIELNSLDLSARKFNSSTLPVNIRKSFDLTPTFIDIGAGSYQEGMPIMCGSSSSAGSVKSLNSNELNGDKLIECLADAMSEMNPRGQSHGASPAIAISCNKASDNVVTINAGSSLGSTSSSLFTVGSYFVINQGIPHGHATVNTSLASCTSSSSANSNGHNDSGSSAASSFSSNDPIIKQRSKNSPNCENGIFNDEIGLVEMTATRTSRDEP
ncbi:breast carcinoma-amplified sequence 3 isoform X2 [Brachionus plicatilis]|uniref:Breast carcinoma-amplified sequence 3 isoform X2 n=1 Tax=Brachionus plicatilis TaxID=10195 RepID=A0A3M7QA24_BRAPC|nr:breast carcinoma-amplified sequence 3 isoform X2 [Brachionus plicatilis]